MLEGIGLAAIWSVIPLAIGPQATAGAALGLWVLISLLMTASAVALAGLPLATLPFLRFLGTTVTAMLAIVSGPLLAMGAALFTILLMLSCLTRGRALEIGRAHV